MTKRAAGAGQGGDDVFDDPVCEVALLRVAAQVVERQHRKRGLVGQRQRGPLRCAGASENHPVGPDRPLDILEALLAEGDERTAELAPKVVEGRTGDHDPARLGQLLEAGGDVDPVAIDVPVLDDHVSEVDPDAEADALRLGHVRLSPRHAALDRDRARHSVDHGCELVERAVAHELDDAPAVLGDERLDELLAVRIQPGERAAPRRAP